MFHHRGLGKCVLLLAAFLVMPGVLRAGDQGKPWRLLVQDQPEAALRAAGDLGGPLGAWFSAAALAVAGEDSALAGTDAVAVAALQVAAGEFEAAASVLDSLAFVWKDRNPAAANFFLLQRGRAAIAQGAIGLADSLLTVGIARARQGGWPLQECFGLYQRGRARLRMRQIDPPRKDLEAALAIAEGENLPRWAGDAALARSVVDRLQMDLPGARAWRERSLEFYRTAGDLAGQARALHYLGVIDLMEGKLARAVAGFGEALDLARRAGDPQVEGAVLGEMAGANYLLGDFDAALDQYAEAIRLVGNPWRQGMMLSNIGSIHEYRQQYEQAREVLPRARRLVHQAGDGRSEAQVLLSLGEVLCEMKEFDAGLAYLDTALTLAREYEAPLTEAWILKVRGHGLLDKGDLEGAAAALDEAVSLSRSVGYFEILEWSLLGQAMVARRQGHLEDALRHLEEALREVGEVRRRSSESSEVAGGVTSQAAGIYAETIDVMYALHVQQPDRGLDRKAFTVNQDAKARVFLNQLAEADYDLDISAVPGYRQRESELLRQMAEIDQARKEAVAGGVPADTLQSLEARHAAIADRLTALEAELREKDPRYAEVLYPHPVTVGELQDRVLKPGELLLDYALGDSASYLWAVGRDTFVFARLPDRAVLTGRVQALLPLLADYNLTGGNPAWYTGPAHALYLDLLGPVEGLVAAADRLIISPDGVLDYVPFGALVERDTESATWSGVPFLVREKVISEIPSASVLQKVRARPVIPGGEPWLLIGDPRLGLAREEDVLARAAGADSLPPLPLAGRELRDLKAMAPPGSVLLQGDQATVVAFAEAGRRGAYAQVHLATHGLYNENNPRYSGLVLSSGRGDSGFLSAAQVFGLDLDCRQVVLAACASGLGRQVGGEGLVGLVRSFLFAGARSVVAALWNVPDEASYRMMDSYYRLLAGSGEDPALALARAQRAMCAGDTGPLTGGLDPAFPGFWSEFVLHGDTAGGR